MNRQINVHLRDTKWGQGERQQLEIHQNVILCCLHLSVSLSLHPDGYQPIANLPLTCWQVHGGRSCIFHPSHFHCSCFSFLSILCFWSVWVNSTKGNFLFTLQHAFSLTRWHWDNTLWELRVSLMRCKCKCTTEHTSTPQLKTCTLTCYRKGLCGMMTPATKCNMKVQHVLLWADKQWGNNFT